MGLVDGPGIRYVVFMQGCSIRCSFCHNPDSRTTGGQEITADELMQKIVRFRPYFERSGGGVTFSGGEPLLQKAFVAEIFSRCNKLGIHTCLDTSGAVKGDFADILKNTDLVLYDVKAITNEGYWEICNGDIAVTEDFQKQLVMFGTKTIVRQVVVPGINDNDDYMQNLKEYIKNKIPHACGVELLPYHLLGSHKYKKSGIPEPLSGTPAMDKNRVIYFQQKYFS